MSSFPVLTAESAPERSRPSLQALQRAFGFVPNVAGTMANSPVLISTLVAVFEKVHGGSFSEAQIQTLLLTNAVTNVCPWAVAFHSFLALEEGMPVGDVNAIRERRLPDEPTSAALSLLARTLIEKRGRLQREDQDAFFRAGFSEAHLLEVIAVVAASAITNYTANVTQPPIESAFQAHAWLS